MTDSPAHRLFDMLMKKFIEHEPTITLSLLYAHHAGCVEAYKSLRDSNGHELALAVACGEMAHMLLNSGAMSSDALGDLFVAAQFPYYADTPVEEVANADPIH